MSELRVYWDQVSQGGKKAYQMGPRYYRVYLLDVLKNWHIKSFLDVGCGTGPLCEIILSEKSTGYDVSSNDPTRLITLQRWNFIYKGVDYSEGMIEVAKGLFPDADFEVQDMRHLKELNDSWDCVTLIHSLDHVDDYMSALREAVRVTKQYVAIMLWRPINYGDKGHNDLNSVSQQELPPGKERWEDTHLQDYTWSVLEQAFKDAGLTLLMEEHGNPVNIGGTQYTFFLLEKNHE